MSITGYQVRYGNVTYEHREDDEPFPLDFRRRVGAVEGMIVQGPEGPIDVDPDDPDTTYHYLVQILHRGRQPDWIGYVSYDGGNRRVVL